MAVPEPSTLALFVTGLAGLGFMMRRRRKVEAAATTQSRFSKKSASACLLRFTLTGAVFALTVFSSRAEATLILEIGSTGIINGEWSLMTVDQTSGTATQVGSLGGAGITAQGLAYDPG